jgi:putative flippase GtrA
MTFVRYIAVQLVAYGIDMGGFLVMLTLTSAGPVADNVVGKLLAGIFAFLCHRRITFRSAGTTTIWRQAIRYFPLLAVVTPLSSALLAILLRWISEPVAAKFVADVICVAVTYLLSKHFVFIGKATPTAATAAPHKANA